MGLKKGPLTYREYFIKRGWKVHPFYASKKVNGYEIDIEFCIGDFCVGVFDADLNLAHPKYRAQSFYEALGRADAIEANIQEGIFKPTL